LKVYAADVRSGKFPDADHANAMKPEEADRLQSLMAKRTKA
jgi:hypothetical protein